LKATIKKIKLFKCWERCHNQQIHVLQGPNSSRYMTGHARAYRRRAWSDLNKLLILRIVVLLHEVRYFPHLLIPGKGWQEGVVNNSRSKQSTMDMKKNIPCMLQQRGTFSSHHKGDLLSEQDSLFKSPISLGRCGACKSNHEHIEITVIALPISCATIAVSDLVWHKLRPDSR
jgi:hypothetical protein